MRILTLPSVGSRFLTATMLLLLSAHATVAEANDWFDVWHNADKWYEAGHATLNPDQNRLLVGKPGTGVLLNGKTGRANSLVTKQTYQDVQVHVEFVVAKGSNSGVIFHGNYEIQILDSAHIEAPTGAHCGGVYPRAEGEPGKPSYRHIDAGSPPRVNAARPPGQWQSMDIIFQAPRFDEAGNKTANAKFVKVIHNGVVIQENHEMPHAHGPNWDRQQFPNGRVVLQGDYGPIALRNVRVRDWDGKTDIASVPGSHRRQTVESDAPHALASVATKRLNVPPEGFTALFNGKDLAGWRVHPKVTEMWSIEDGVLKSHGLLEEWGADLVTEKEYQDYVLMADFRMPALSDSGIHFRNLAPAMLGKMGDAEQFNIHPKGGMGHLESFRFAPESMGLPEDQLPKVKHVDPEIGVWHTIKLSVVGKNVTAELDGEVILDHFEYPDGMLKAGPNPIRFQKHRFTEGAKPGERNPCPIEFRNIFIKEITASDSPEPRGLNVPPAGFTALFNGKDLSGWHTRPEVTENWFVEDGLLKSTTLVEHYRASLLTKKSYRDFILMLEFRMPTISDSGICFRTLIPEIPGFGTKEQFNLRSRGGMGHLESYYFLPKETAEKVGLKEEEKPHVRHIDPEVGVWHKVKLTMKGRTFSAEYDGEVLHDNFQFHDWMLNMEPAPIMLQKHMVVRGDNLGVENPCPIEYRNVFIKELGPDDAVSAASSLQRDSQRNLPKTRDAELLARIDARELPTGYVPAKHQEYVDRHWPKLSPEQVTLALQLWKEKQRIDPNMPNHGFSFVKIMDFVAEHEMSPSTGRREAKTIEDPVQPPASPKTETRPTSSSSPTSRPNVVVLLSDDLGSQDIGCYGGPVNTPTLDSLATRGVRFTDFHAGAAICSPSRATLMTGRQHLRTGIFGVLQDHMHNAHLLEWEVTIAEVLQQTGYSTAHFGKWHIGMTSGKRKKPGPTEHGFDYWFGLSNGAHPSHKDPVNFLRNGKSVGPLKGYSCQLLVDDAIRWLDAKDKPDQPFFLNVWFNEPHHPLAAPDEIVSQYGDLKDQAAIYSATIDNTDRAIGRLVAELKDMNQLDNTLIIYSSDHGSYRADRNGGLHGSKGSNFEGGLRSPGIFFWPRGFQGGRVENTPSGSVDLLPTICGLVGIENPASVHLDGADLSPLLTGQGKFQRKQPLFWLAPTSGHLGTLRDGRYTLMGYRDYDLPWDHATRNRLLREMARLAGIDVDTENFRNRIDNTTFTSPEFRRLRGEYVKLTTFQESWIPIIKSGGFSHFALYDLEADPKQTNDISRQEADVTARLKKKLLTLYKSVMADAPDWSGQQ